MNDLMQSDNGTIESEYEQAINDLIPIALENTKNFILAEREIKGMPKLSKAVSIEAFVSNYPGRDRIYHHEMNRLAREAGLRNI